MRIFIKGATGILGKRLVRELIGRGHSFTGMVRSARGEELVRSMGGTPSRTGLFDGEALLHAVEGSDVVIRRINLYSVSTGTRGFPRIRRHTNPKSESSFGKARGKTREFELLRTAQ